MRIMKPADTKPHYALHVTVFKIMVFFENIFKFSRKEPDNTRITTENQKVRNNRTTTMKDPFVLILFLCCIIGACNAARTNYETNAIQSHGSVEAYESAVAQESENRRIQRLAEAVDQAARDRRAVEQYNFIKGVQIAAERAAQSEVQR